MIARILGFLILGFMALIAGLLAVAIVASWVVPWVLGWSPGL